MRVAALTLIGAIAAMAAATPANAVPIAPKPETQQAQQATNLIQARVWMSDREWRRRMLLRRRLARRDPWRFGGPVKRPPMGIRPPIGTLPGSSRPFR